MCILWCLCWSSRLIPWNCRVQGIALPATTRRTWPASVWPAAVSSTSRPWASGDGEKFWRLLGWEKSGGCWEQNMGLKHNFKKWHENEHDCNFEEPNMGWMVSELKDGVYWNRTKKWDEKWWTWIWLNMFKTGTSDLSNWVESSLKPPDEVWWRCLFGKSFQKMWNLQQKPQWFNLRTEAQPWPSGFPSFYQNESMVIL